MFRNLTPAVKQILIANIVLFIGKFLLDKSGQIDLVNLLGEHYFRSPDFRLWQPITSMFMHANEIHIISNMLSLFFIGSILENFMGTKKFLILYFISGFGALALDVAMHAIEMFKITGQFFPSLADLSIKIENDLIYYPPTYSKADINSIMEVFQSTVLGASGALYGLASAFAFYFPNSQLTLMFIPYPIRAKYLIPIILGLDLFLGIGNFGWDSIAHFAHIGGGITGFILVWYWRKFDKRNFY
ncbi:MAG TPA: rhomboid family intramembrane serine protease [Bacteroidia bacterium]